MELRDYARVLMKHWRLIAVVVLISLGGAAFATLRATPIYQASTQLFVSASVDTTNATAGALQGSQFSQQRVKSYADIVTSPQVTNAVIAKLGLRESPDALEGQISASAPLDTVLINVSVKDASPLRAQQIANATSAEFAAFVNKLETPPGADNPLVTISVVRQASLPTAPVTPRKKLNLALGLLVGLAIGAGAAVLRDTLDTTLRGVEAVQELLGVPVLGVIAFDTEAADRPLVVVAAPRSPGAEAFRQLRTNLQFVDIDNHPKSIVITSSVAGEGKTTTACNLALTLAQTGMRVLLVEADLRRPKATEYLGLVGAVGVTDVLIGRVSVEDAVQQWGDTTLSVLPSGPVPPNPSELLGADSMRDLLTRLEQSYDIVLLDAPPLLAVTDAAVLSTISSGAVIVLRHGSTRREQAMRAQQALQSVDARILGSVITMAPERGPDAYGYAYGYYYSNDTDEPKRPKAQPTAAAAAVAPDDTRSGRLSGPTLALVAVVLASGLAVGVSAARGDQPASEDVGSRAAVTAGGTCAYRPSALPAARAVSRPPATGVELKRPFLATLRTNVGTIAVALDTAAAPCTVNSFRSLAHYGYFTDTDCHRLTTRALFVLQCGDPTGRGDGGPGYTFADENPSHRTYPRGTVAMANVGRDSNGSQFFLVYRDSPLPPSYTVFGHVTSGLDVLDRVAAAGTATDGDGRPRTRVTITAVRVSAA